MSTNVNHETGCSGIAGQLAVLAEELSRIAVSVEKVQKQMASNEFSEVHLQQQLANADQRIQELEALLVLKALPAGSLDNVLQMAKAA